MCCGCVWLVEVGVAYRIGLDLVVWLIGPADGKLGRWSRVGLWRGGCMDDVVVCLGGGDILCCTVRGFRAQ